jgi:hypothetical protein
MMRNAAFVLLGLALAACSTVGPAPGPGVSPGAYRPSPPPRAPAAVIVGHGAYHTRSGASAGCAGLSVALMRDTPGFRSRILALYGSTETARLSVATVTARSAKLGPAEGNPLADSVTCGADGGFVFRAVAPGSYFLIARVKTVNVRGVAEDLVVMRHIALVDGETRDVSLAP